MALLKYSKDKSLQQKLPAKNPSYAKVTEIGWTKEQGQNCFYEIQVVSASTADKSSVHVEKTGTILGLR